MDHGRNFDDVWVSYSSLTEFLRCPRAYFLHNIYRDPYSHHKMTLASPPLSLGLTVHAVIEALSKLPTDQRLDTPLRERFLDLWHEVMGKRGGFTDEKTEQAFRYRGLAIMERLHTHPGPLSQLAVRIKDDLPHFYLSEEDGIVLCGKIDWLTYKPDSDSVEIIDFKTGKNREDAESWQLPIYYLLARKAQKRAVTGMAYWYLDQDDEPMKVPITDIKPIAEEILKTSKKIKLARKLNTFACKQKDGCRWCRPYEKILKGEAEFVYTNDRSQDVYILPFGGNESDDNSEIL